MCLSPKPKDDTSKGHEKGDWYYIVRPDESKPAVSFSLGLGPHAVDERVDFRPTVLTMEEFKKLNKEIVYEKQAHFYLHEYNAENFGHFVSDLLLPIYSALEAWDELDYDVQVVRFQPDDPIGHSCDFQRMPKLCVHFYEMMSPMISKHPFKLMKNILTDSNKAICYDKLFAGASLLTDDCFDGNGGRGKKEGDPGYPNTECMSGRQRQLWNFKEYTMQNVNVDSTPTKKHTVLIWHRTSKRVYKSLPLLATTLNKTWGNKVDVVLVTDWGKYSLIEQLELIARTTVHVTGPGGGSFISMYLPRGSTTIRLYNQQELNLMEAELFDYLAFVHPVYITLPEGGDIVLNDMLAHVETGLRRYEDFGAPLDPANQLDRKSVV